MNKIRVIDLLKKITNKEDLPEKIKLEQGAFTLREDCGGDKWYGREYDHLDFFETISRNLEFVLNQEIEIIEEDKPIEKINGLNHSLTERLSLIREDIGLAFETIDLLIDKVNELNESKEDEERTDR